GSGIRPAVRNRDQNITDVHALRLVLGGATHQHVRPTVRVITNFHIGPAQAAPPASAETLEDRLLGGPAAGEGVGGMFPGLAVADFPFRIDSVQEQFTVLLDHAADAQAFYDIGADSNDFHARLTSRWARSSPADLSKDGPGLYNPISSGSLAAVRKKAAS